MKKIILIIAIAGALAFNTTGCEIDTSEEGSKKRTLNETTNTNWTNKVEFYTDPDTGVQYLIFKIDDNYIIQPRYNSDGTIKTID